MSSNTTLNGKSSKQAGPSSKLPRNPRKKAESPEAVAIAPTESVSPAPAVSAPIAIQLGQIVEIPLDQINAGNNDRKRFRPEELEALAKSLQSEGLIQPITLRPKADRFEIVAGERRYRAALLAGWSSIPAIIKDLQDDPASAVMLAENTGRVNLSPIEEAKAYRKRKEAGWTEARIAETAGVSPELVGRRLNLLTLEDTVQHLLDIGDFPIGHAEAMIPLDRERQQMAFRIYLNSKLGIPLLTFKSIVEKLKAEQDQTSLFELEAFFLELVASDLPSRGKGASPAVPTRDDLPAVPHVAKASIAGMIENYIDVLTTAGLKDEAATVGTLYTALVRQNFIKMPTPVPSE